MNKLSKKVLYELDEDSRSKLSNISKKCKTSQQMISYTIKQLIKKKEILGFTTVFDYGKFGLHSYIVLFRLLYRKKQDFNKFINNLKNTNELINLEILEGKFDVYAKFLAPNPSYFNKILRKIKTDNKKVLRSDTIITTVVTYIFKRDYLTNKRNLDRNYSIIGGDRKTVKLSQNQIHICSTLLNNSGERINNISKKTGLSFLTITNAIKSLKKEKIIKSFKPIISFNKNHLFCKKILIKYQNFTLNIEDELIEFCKKSNNIIKLTKTFGEWDLILTIETLKKKTFDDFLLNLRERYEDIISDFEVLKVVEIEELRYLPKNYFNVQT